MPRRPAYAVSLYLSGRRVVVVGEGRGADERVARLQRAGADLTRLAAADVDADALRSCALLVVQPDGPAGAEAERLAAAGRAHGCLVYVHDRPDISDLAMPALVRRGPLSIAISTDAVAPALARRLREQLEGLVSAAGRELDGLLARLEVRRAELPPSRRGELYDEAARLRIEGRLRIDDA
jgi:uroporphyrin-III C-methyltransferase / precorrin-2 dehydrogenase / sirohydrochlorin ferrochelatase